MNVEHTEIITLFNRDGNSYKTVWWNSVCCHPINSKLLMHDGGAVQ